MIERLPGDGPAQVVADAGDWSESKAERLQAWASSPVSRAGGCGTAHPHWRHAADGCRRGSRWPSAYDTGCAEGRVTRATRGARRSSSRRAGRSSRRATSADPCLAASSACGRSGRWAARRPTCSSCGQRGNRHESGGGGLPRGARRAASLTKASQFRSLVLGCDAGRARAETPDPARPPVETSARLPGSPSLPTRPGATAGPGRSSPGGPTPRLRSVRCLPAAFAAGNGRAGARPGGLCPPTWGSAGRRSTAPPGRPTARPWPGPRAPRPRS